MYPDSCFSCLREEALGHGQPGDPSWLHGPPVFRQPRVIPLTLASNHPSDHGVLLPTGQGKENDQENKSEKLR